MTTVAEITKESRDIYSKMTKSQLYKELMDYGVNPTGMTESEAITTLVDLDVKAFTH